MNNYCIPVTLYNNQVKISDHSEAIHFGWHTLGITILFLPFLANHNRHFKFHCFTQIINLVKKSGVKCAVTLGVR